MQYRRMPIEIESPEQMGYERIRYNLSESSYTDVLMRDIGLDLEGLGRLVLCYGDHAGLPELRALIAAGGQGLRPEDVLLTMGAAGALFIVATALLEPGDELVVVRPNYATNIETPIAIGARPVFIDLRFEDGFRLDIQAVRRAISPATRLISVTHPHNPTGICLQESEIRELAAIAEEKGIWLLVDETYRELTEDAPLPLAATFGKRVISVSSMSKAYGLPGIRLGWLICRDPQMMNVFLAAKEQIQICGSLLDETVALAYLRQSDRFVPAIRVDLAEKRAILRQWMAGQEYFEWIEPAGGVVCFPRMMGQYSQEHINTFHSRLMEEYGTYVGPGHWFDMPDSYIRIGFGWPSGDQLKAGLAAITACMRACTSA